MKINIKHSNITKDKMRLTHLKNGTGKWMIGRKLSQKTKDKMSKIAKIKGFGKWMKGRKSINWKGGKYIDNDGYMLILSRTHPNANNQGYVREHRLIMEKHLGRILLKSEIVHHINNDKKDNRIENLMLFSSCGEHIKYHSQIKNIKRIIQ
jgi:hypothetical protein